MNKILSWFINLCALWIILSYVLGFFWPELFFWFSKGKWMTYALALVMLCMGLSLKLSDFAELFKQPKVVLLAATLLHGLGKAFGYDRDICKAIACETGMQNGGLAATLAKNNFPAYMPVVGVPSIFCSIMQSAIGGVMASIWRMTSVSGLQEKDKPGTLRSF